MPPLDLEKILRRERLLRALTSCSRAQFDQLLAQFEERWDSRHVRRTWSGERRQRAPGAGGQNSRLPRTSHKLLFVLFYAKFRPIQQVMAQLFGFSQPQACYWIGRLSPLLQAALGQRKAPAPRPSTSLAEILAGCPELQQLFKEQERKPEAAVSATKKRPVTATVVRGGLERRGTVPARRAATPAAKRLLVPLPS